MIKFSLLLRKAGGFVADHWQLFLFAALIAGNFIFFYAWRGAVADYDALVVAGKEQAKATGAVIAKQNKITEDTVNAYQDALVYLRDHPQRVLQRSGCGALPAISETAKGINGAGADAILTPERVEEDSAKTTLMLNQLQDWILQQQSLSAGRK